MTIKNVFEGTPFVWHFETALLDSPEEAALAELHAIRDGVDLNNISADHSNYHMIHSVYHILDSDLVATHIAITQTDSVWQKFLKELF